jgi:RNA polymerase sigma-32 factor
MEGRLAAHDTSFDAQDDDDSSPPAPAEYLEDSSADPALILEQLDHGSHQGEQLLMALEALDPRSRDILERRWLNEPKATLHDLAAIHGVSAERIRQLEQNAMKRLRSAIDA